MLLSSHANDLLHVGLNFLDAASFAQDFVGTIPLVSFDNLAANQLSGGATPYSDCVWGEVVWMQNAIRISAPYDPSSAIQVGHGTFH